MVLVAIKTNLKEFPQGKCTVCFQIFEMSISPDVDN